ncbi:MAG TPA: arylesterase [Verrucomicrobiae bacterium]|nr:arylesterase [Verrucomicrobiae bacterium]
MAKTTVLMRRVLVLLAVLLINAPAGAAKAAAPVILVWGDSLSAAYGIPVESGWVQLMQKRLREQGYPHRVVNGSVSGETTGGGLRRLPDALARHKPKVVVIELGGNDGLRGLPVKQLRANLDRMIALSRKVGARVLITEMMIPPNYGPTYTDAYNKTFHQAAKASGIRLIPFPLGPIATDPKWFLDDGIHPSVPAQPRLLDIVWPEVQSVLAEAAGASGKMARP